MGLLVRCPGAGESYCNLPQLTATQGQRARFHIFTLGTEDDLHGPNIAATTFVDNVCCRHMIACRL